MNQLKDFQDLSSITTRTRLNVMSMRRMERCWMLLPALQKEGDYSNTWWNSWNHDSTTSRIQLWFQLTFYWWLVSRDSSATTENKMSKRAGSVTRFVGIYELPISEECVNLRNNWKQRGETGPQNESALDIESIILKTYLNSNILQIW